MAIYNTAIGVTNTTLNSGTGNRAITTVIFCNTAVSDRTLTVYATSAATSDTSMIVSALPIPAGETVSFDQEKVVLASGDDLVAVGSGTGLTATVSTLAV